MAREVAKGKKRAAQLLAGTLALSGVLSACAGQGGEPASTPQGSGGDAPMEVTVMTHFFGATPPATDNPVKVKIEEATNTKLNIQWVSANNYKDKFNVTLASGAIPDLIFVPDPYDTVFRKAAEQGAFWDVSPYIDQYPYMKEKIAPIAWEMTRMNGANYGLPRPRPSEGEGFFVVRKDWLDKLGLKEPTTPDELYEVMKAFAKQDPDGNGQHDTIGLVGHVNPTDMGSLAEVERMFTRTFGEWKQQDDGKLVHVATLPETRQALEYMAKAYGEGLIPLDFASMKVSQVKDMYKAGKAGIIVEKTGALQETYDALKQIDPNFDFKNLYPLTNVNGYNPKGPGFSGLIAIPKSVKEEKLKKILAMVDRWSQDDVFALHQGIEGVHYTVKDGKTVVDTEKVAADSISNFNQIVYVSDPYASTVKTTFPEDVQKLYASIQDERAKTSVGDVSMGLYSETGATFMPEFRKNVQDLKTKIILGREPIEAWDQFVASLASNENFKKTTEEMNEALKNR